MQSDWPIRRDYLPPDLEPELRACALDGCVAVQARQTLEESRWLLELAERAPMIKGVVGWVDLRSEQVGQQLAQFAAHSKLVGVRHVVQDEPDDQFLLRADFQRGLVELRQFDLTYDLLIFPRQLPAAIELVRRFPEQPFILDHLAKPLIKARVLSPWREQIRELAQMPHVMCKVSGLVTEAAWTSWQASDFAPYLDVVFEAFGPDRLMYGSDWSVCLLAGSYQRVFNLAKDYVSRLGAGVEEKFFGRTAASFYGLA